MLITITNNADYNKMMPTKANTENNDTIDNAIYNRYNRTNAHNETNDAIDRNTSHNRYNNHNPYNSYIVSPEVLRWRERNRKSERGGGGGWKEGRGERSFSPPSLTPPRLSPGRVKSKSAAGLRGARPARFRGEAQTSRRP